MYYLWAWSSSNRIKEQTKYFIFPPISREPEQLLTAAVETIEIHVDWKYEFSMSYKLFACIY